GGGAAGGGRAAGGASGVPRPPPRAPPPVLEPDREGRHARPGQRRRAAAPTLREGMRAGRDVGQGEVGEVDLVRGEAGAVGRGARGEAAAEERELEAEASASGRFELAREVPPLR